jgi:hypothetical protein
MIHKIAWNCCFVHCTSEILRNSKWSCSVSREYQPSRFLINFRNRFCFQSTVNRSQKSRLIGRSQIKAIAQSHISWCFTQFHPPTLRLLQVPIVSKSPGPALALRMMNNNVSILAWIGQWELSWKRRTEKEGIDGKLAVGYRSRRPRYWLAVSANHDGHKLLSISASRECDLQHQDFWTALWMPSETNEYPNRFYVKTMKQ